MLTNKLVLIIIAVILSNENRSFGSDSNQIGEIKGQLITSIVAPFSLSL